MWKTLWRAIATILAVILIILVLIVAWEAILVAFGEGAVAYGWMGAYGSLFVSLGVWAANNALLFAVLSFAALAVLSPEIASQVVQAIGDIASEIIQTVADLADDAADALIPDWVWYAAGLFGLVYLSRSNGTGGGRSLA